MVKLKPCCRICLKTEGNLRPLSSCDFDDVTYLVKMRTCVPHLFIDDANMPELICGECAQHLRTSYDFYRRSTISYTTLKMSILKAENMEITISVSGQNQQLPPPPPLTEVCAPSPTTDPLASSPPHLTSPMTPDDDEPLLPIVKQERRDDDEDEIMVEGGSEPIKPIIIDPVVKDEPLQRKNEVDLPKVSFLTHSETVFQCSMCKRRFQRLAALKIHTLNKHGIRLQQRPPAPTTNGQSANSNTPPRPAHYICTLCARGFSGRQSLIVHMQRHTKDKFYICSHCHRSFVQCAALQSHKCVVSTFTTLTET